MACIGRIHEYKTREGSVKYRHAVKGKKEKAKIKENNGERESMTTWDNLDQESRMFRRERGKGHQTPRCESLQGVSAMQSTRE